MTQSGRTGTKQEIVFGILIFRIVRIKAFAFFSADLTL